MRGAGRNWPWAPVAALLVSALLITAAGYLVYRQQYRVHSSEAALRVETGAALDAERAADWYGKRLAIASGLAASPFTGPAVRDWIADPTPELDQLLEQRAAGLLGRGDFVGARLYDKDGRALRHTGVLVDADDAIRRAIEEAVSSREVVTTEIRRLPGQSFLGVDFVVPLLVGSGTDATSIGSIVISGDVTPLLRSLGRPFDGEGLGRVVLVWRSGAELAFLDGYPRTTGLPEVRRLDARRVAGWQAQASHGRLPAFEAEDPGGQPVIAAVEPAAGTPWTVVALQDARAIRDHTLGLMLEIASLALVGLGTAAGLALLWWRAEMRRTGDALLRSAERAEEIEARLGWLERDANDIILLIDLDGRILDANPRAVAAYGRDLHELVGMSSLDLRPPDPGIRHDAERKMAAVLRDGSAVYETTHRRRDGSTFPVEVSVRVVDHAGRRFFQSIIRDVSERREQAERLQRSEAAYRRLFQSNPNPMWVFDSATLRFLAVNDAAIAQYGYSEDEFLAMTIEDIRPPEDLPRLRANLARFGDQVLQSSSGWRHRRRDGTLIDVEIASHDLEFRGRRARVVLAQDVTRRLAAERSLKASEERYRRLFDQASDGIVQVGRDGRVLDANAEAQKLFGRTQEELRSLDVVELLAEADRSRLVRLMRAARDNQPAPSLRPQWQLLRRDGSRFTAEIRARALEDGTFIVTLRDLTEAIAAQQRLERQRVLEAEKERAEAADRAKTAFLRSVSHELRSPLHAIMGFTSTLLEGIGGELNPMQREQMQIVNDSARHLLDIINDLLDISRIEAGAVSIEARPYRPIDVLRRVQQRFRLQAAAKQLDFRVDCEPEHQETVGDERRVEQVISNLVSNAIKFTASGSVTVRCRAEDERLRYEVADTGRGIADGDRPKLFNYFSQLEPGPGALTEGTGLGLAIALGLAEAMEGAIEVRSKPGRGSVFTLVLPLRAGTMA